MNNGAIIDRLANLFPVMSPVRATVAQTIYKVLARSDNASVKEVADLSKLPTEDVEEMLDDWAAVFRNDKGDVIGFWGLTGQEMHHRFIVDGKTRYAWCAWDALFIPELIDKSADVISSTVINSYPVDLTVTPDQVLINKPVNAPLFVSFNLPDDENWEENVLATFCHHVHFLCEDETDEWVTANPNGTFLPVDKAFEAGREKNARQFGVDRVP